jgi:endonuclease/exonuclease/phosphatase family metal-dependent hydrolase
MRTLRVTTWNVLHRVHAENWKEAPVAEYRDERPRIEGVSAVVVGWLASGVDVVCLQEVSGDQLASLRSHAPPRARLFAHVYPRVPRMRDEHSAHALVDPTEHLVTIVTGVTGATASPYDARTFESDPGKGLLAIDLDGLAVINTHLSFGPRRDAQLAVVSDVARRAVAGAVAMGDFNCPADVVAEALRTSGETLEITNLAGQGPTRIATADHHGKTIDHVVVLRGKLSDATVLDGGGLSDHHPVTARIAILE